jgi:hypothetical protein
MTRGCDNRCPDCPPPVPKGTVRFIITDTSSNAPIQFISIKLGATHGTWAASDEDGIALIQNINVGYYSAQFSGALYATKSQIINVEQADKTFQIYMMKVDTSDLVSPSILAYAPSGGDFWVLFSERMRKRSVDSAIWVARWKAFASRENQDCVFSQHDTIDTHFTTDWIESNIFHIVHATKDSVRCREVSGQYEFWPFYWNPLEIGISTYARDFAGNNLDSSLYYAH